MLWLIRRPFSRRLQRALIKTVPEGQLRESAGKRMLAQEKWARKYGLKVLEFVFAVFYYCLGLAFVMFLVMQAIEHGWLQVEFQK